MPMSDETASELIAGMASLTAAIAGLTVVLLEDGGEVEADEPAPIATYADGTPIG